MIDQPVRLCVFVSRRSHRVVAGRGSESAGHSVCSRWCQQTVPVNSDSISAGICGNWREREEAGAKGDTGRIVALSDSPFSLISSRSSYRKPDGSWGLGVGGGWALSLLTPLSLQFLSRSAPSFALLPFYIILSAHVWLDDSSGDSNGHHAKFLPS